MKNLMNRKSFIALICSATIVVSQSFIVASEVPSAERTTKQKKAKGSATQNAVKTADQPMTYADMETILKELLPKKVGGSLGTDQILASEISKRGVAFKMDSAIHRCLRDRFHAGPMTLKALKDADDENVAQGKSMKQANPVCAKTKILVANFLPDACDGGRPSSKVPVTDRILGRLRGLKDMYSDIDVEALGESITAQQAVNNEALAKAQEHNADVLLWGLYCDVNPKHGEELKPDEEAQVSVEAHFEILHGPSQVFDRIYNSAPATKGDNNPSLLSDVFLQRVLDTTRPKAELSDFSVKFRLADQMAYLTLLSAAIARLDVEDYDGAIDRCNLALQEWSGPQSIVPRARAKLVQALAYYLNGNNKRAIDTSTDAIDLDPGTAFNYVIRSAFQDWSGKYDAAVKDLLHAIELEPKNAHYHVLLGWVYGNNRKYKDALDELSAAIDLDERDAEPRFARAVIYLAEALHARRSVPSIIDQLQTGYVVPKAIFQPVLDSLDALRQAADSKDSNQQEVLFSDVIGKLILALDAYARGIEALGDAMNQVIVELSAAIDLESRRSKSSRSSDCPINCAALYHINRGVAYGQKSMGSTLLNIFDEWQKPLKIIKADFDVLIDMRRKGAKDSQEQKSMLEALDPPKRAELVAALTTFREFMDADPFKREDEIGPEEQSDFNAAIQSDSQGSDTYFLLGEAYLARSMSDKAIQYIGKAVEIDPYELDYFYELAKLYEEKGSYNLAIIMYKNAIAQDLDHTCAYCHDDLGLAYVHEKQYDKAINCFREAIHLDGEWARTYYHLGHAQHLAGDKVAALLSLKKALTLDIRPSLRKKVEDELKEIQAK